MRKNIILNTDSYKTGHYLQYPPGTEVVYSYIEARNDDDRDVVVFGLQAFIKEYLTRKINYNDINAAEEIFKLHGVPFNRAGWELIIERYDGYLPIEIQMVPEGTVVKGREVIAVMFNTDADFNWLTNYLETAILRAIWYPTTVASNSRQAKQIITKYWEITSDSPIESLDFKLHDFGARGVSSDESAGIGGMAHLLNFKGTDTISAIRYAKEYYGADMAGFSIPAAEHSTITSWGKSRESDAYLNMIESFDSPVVAIVSDSYDLENAVKQIYGKELKSAILESGKTVVIRPDSGDPVEIVTQTIKNLMDSFGYSLNSKGFKVLPDCVRVIQGDGITNDSIELILERMESEKLSIDNIAFGMGGGLLQMCNRDTFGFAMKCSAIKIDGKWHDVFKAPKTDPSKASKRGRFDNPKLETVFRNGYLLRDMTWDEVLSNLK